MPEREFVTSDKLEKTREKYTYSHAVKVGNTVYVGGQVSRDKNDKVLHKRDFVSQIDKALENLQNVLEAAGATMQDVVKMNFFCRHIWDLKDMPEVFKKYFGDHLPAWTGVEVVQLWNPHFLIEIEAIAIIGEKQVIIGE